MDAASGDENASLSQGDGREVQGAVRWCWADLLWVAFLAGLALMPPLWELHKQLTLLGIGIFQIFEQPMLRWLKASYRLAASLVIKIVLATTLVGHTGEVPINSSYYLIYYLPVISAAMHYGPLGMVLWTSLASAAYCSFLIPALEEYELTAAGATELAIRCLFFFLAAVLVNRLMMERQRQALRTQRLAESLAEVNRHLSQAQAEARRSERLAALGQLSAGLAHEIRNPLGIIRGSAEMLQKKLKSDDSLPLELAGNISSEVSRLTALVARFLNFVRPFQLHLQAQQIERILDRALKGIHERLPEAKIEVIRQYTEGLPEIPVDPELCEHMFTNLFLNAWEAMPEGGTLRVKTAVSAAPKGVTVDVDDSGSGVPEEVREQIFNPFFTTKKEGVGLGLAIVAKIVDDHRGSIRLISSSGKGACFRVFLPSNGQA